MTEVRVRSVEEVIAGLIPAFVEDTRDKLINLSNAVDTLANIDGQAGAINDFLREVHSIKGVAGSFGFSFIAVVCHKLEDYIVKTPVFTRKETDDIIVFFQEIERILERGADPSDADGFRIFRNLPSYVDVEKFFVEPKMVEAIFIGPRDVQFLIIEKQLKNCGIRSVNASKSLLGVELTLRTKPDFVMVSNVIDSISGVEVINILQSIHITRAIPTMFTINEIDLRENRQKLEEALPKGVQFIRKGTHFPDDFADALVALKIL